MLEPYTAPTAFERTIDELHNQMRSPTRRTGLADSLYSVFAQHMSSDVPKQSYESKSEWSERVLHEVSKENAWFLHEGRTRPNEERSFVKGDPDSTLIGILFVLGQLPLVDATVPTVDFILATPDESGRPQWNTQTIPNSLVELFVELGVRDEPEVEAEDEKEASDDADVYEDAEASDEDD